MLSPGSGGEVLLLKQILPTLQEIAELFNSNEKKAKKARSRLGKRDPHREAFYAKLSVDAEDLFGILKGIPDTWSDGEGDGVQSLRCLLTTIETFCNADDSGEDEDSDGDADAWSFPQLKVFLRQLKYSALGPVPAKAVRIQWFCDNTEFERPDDDVQDLLLDNIKSCSASLKIYAQSTPVDISWLPDDRSTKEWDGARIIYDYVERLHKALTECWTCGCFGNMTHKDAKFSFDLVYAHAEDTLSCTMFYPTADASGSYVWQSTHLQYCTSDRLHAVSLHPVEAERGRYDRDSRRSSLSQRRRSAADPHAFCDHLENSKAGHMVRLANGVTELCETPDKAQHVHTNEDPLPLADCLKLSATRSLHGVKQRQRLMLALVLCYAYVHLGGGAWWPYSDNSSVCIFQQPSPETLATRIPFFTPSWSDSSNKNSSTFILTQMNKAMPSLPALGKLLLELWLGKHVTWDDLQDECKRSRDEMFATEMLHAVNVCCGMSDDDTFTTGGRIRDDERLRSHFVKEVLLQVQYVIETGYRLTMQDVFQSPDASRISELQQSPTKVPLRLRSPTPLGIDGPETVPNDCCLHDGQDMEKLDDADAALADKWMSDMSECMAPALRGKLSRGAGGASPSPVRIAILDTGADISSNTLDATYDGRLIERRTWLKSVDKHGETLTGGSLDPDGHGTHATCVLLDATQDTDTEVYVAQVFGKRSDKITKDKFTDQHTVTRINQAIRYAVDVWQVDIITMSFGFPEPIPDIAGAIDHAYEHEVLMLAAASNVGANKARTWPARHEHVMCIYATNGLGNRYEKNPTRKRNKDNFAVLGSSVSGLWPPDSNGKASWVRKSGTSTASPIAAAIASMVIGSLRVNETAYLDTMWLDAKRKEAERKRFDRKLQALGRPQHMADVFRMMVGEEGERDDYQYVAPWRIFHGNYAAPTSMIERILEKIDA